MPHDDRHSEPLSERERVILQTVVTEFIATGDPVGSTSVVERAHLDVSSATVRNTMVRLAERGLLNQPHTSAGRVPTVAALRTYVERMLQPAPLPEDVRRRLSQLVIAPRRPGSGELLQGVVQLLGDLTSLAAIGSPPRLSHTRLRHIDLSLVAPRRIRVLWVDEAQRVHHRLVTSDSDLSRDELERLRNYLNEVHQGFTLAEIRDRLKTAIDHQTDQYRDLVIRAADLWARTLSQPAQVADAELYLERPLNLIDLVDVEGRAELRALMTELSDKRRLAAILERIAGDESVSTHVVVGLADQDHQRSATDDPLGACSMVVTPYTKDDRTLGWIGVVGPLRMDYGKAVTVVEHAAEAVARQLGGADAA